VEHHGHARVEVGKTDHSMGWYESEYGRPAVRTALEAAGLRLVQDTTTLRWNWRKADNTPASPKDVRKALKTTFPRHYDPTSTYGSADARTGLSV
jgi:hypothetical protein